MCNSLIYCNLARPPDRTPLRGLPSSLLSISSPVSPLLSPPSSNPSSTTLWALLSYSTLSALSFLPLLYLYSSSLLFLFSSSPPPPPPPPLLSSPLLSSPLLSLSSPLPLPLALLIKLHKCFMFYFSTFRLIGWWIMNSAKQGNQFSIYGSRINRQRVVN